MRSATASGSSTHTAESAEEAVALERFARECSRLAHPGVAAILTVGERNGEECLVTERPGDATLEDYPIASSKAVSTLITGLAATVHDLHIAGAVHGEICPRNVAIDPSQRPILLLGTPRELTGDPGDDVEALGTLLHTLIASLPNSEANSHIAMQLNKVADHAITRTIDAATLADLAAMAPRARWHFHARARFLAVAVVLLVIVAAGALTLHRPLGGSGPERSSTPAEPFQPVLANQTGPASVESDGSRYELGIAGDVVSVADWQCSGLAVPLILRPSTGELFLWPDWHTEHVPAVVIIDDLVGLELTQTSCGSLAVQTASSTVLIPLEEITDIGATS